MSIASSIVCKVKSCARGRGDETRVPLWGKHDTNIAWVEDGLQASPEADTDHLVLSSLRLDNTIVCYSSSCSIMPISGS